MISDFKSFVLENLKLKKKNDTVKVRTSILNPTRADCETVRHLPTNRNAELMVEQSLTCMNRTCHSERENRFRERKGLIVSANGW